MVKPVIRRGQVVHFSDGQRVHTALILDVSENKQDAWALFLTSNPLWNKRSRQLTSDELAHFGFPEEDEKHTYFAPVIRPLSDAVDAELDYPEPRVEALAQEFPSPFAPPVLSLPKDKYPAIRNVNPVMPSRSFYDLFSQETKKLKIDKIVIPDDKAALLHPFVRGETILPRHELQSLVSHIPALEKFFTRRASITIPIQVSWELSGRVLAEYRESKQVPRPLLAARLGLPDRDVMAFEAGIQCPSYHEMLVIQGLLPGIPDEWSLPTSTPLMVDIVFMKFARLRIHLNTLSSKTRIPQNRIYDILVNFKKPSAFEIQRLSGLFGPLPPWRPWNEKIDQMGDKQSYVDQLTGR